MTFLCRKGRITGGHGTRWTDARIGHVYVEGGGVFCEFASPLIAYNIIVDNNAVPRPDSRGAGGGGIRCGDGEPEIAHNLIERNHGPYGGGLVLYFTAAHVHDNVIARNSGGRSFGGGGMWIAGRLATMAPVVLRRNVIAFNRAEADIADAASGRAPEAGTGGAIRVYSGGVYDNRVIGCDNIIDRNFQTYGPEVAALPWEVRSGLSASKDAGRGDGNGLAGADSSLTRYLEWDPPNASSSDGRPCAMGRSPR